SSGHAHGELAAARVEAARAEVAAAVGASPEEVLFTSGATEADNLAIFGLTAHAAARGRHLVTARTEHKAVLDPCRALERQGWRVTYVEPDASGRVPPDRMAAALRPDTVLVSLMHVNNETGVVQDVAAYAQICARHGGARLHVDAAQSVGKCAVDFRGCGADLMSLSAHKAYGPKGVGALLVSSLRGVRIEPRQFGGGQERGLRSGTLPTHQVVGMGAAYRLAAATLDAERQRIADLRERLWRGLSASGGAARNGAPQDTVPQILNVTFADVEGESLLAAVAPEISVSAGAACASASGDPSYVLRALGRDPRATESSLRFGLGRFTTEAEIERAVAAVDRALRHLRRIGGACATAS
ncbi:MAG: aminotransferase class V-fold PLP-dependent enzyme, partial [Gammaproteobacteria bacterium]|nr:aminotransferase class V-fold PLP-dependent enzyme [Gammaproteobacteria bacterium]